MRSFELAFALGARPALRIQQALPANTPAPGTALPCRKESLVSPELRVAPQLRSSPVLDIDQERTASGQSSAHTLCRTQGIPANSKVS